MFVQRQAVVLLVAVLLAFLSGATAAFGQPGTAWSWGDGSNGQLGDNSAGAYSNLPVHVKGPGGVGTLTGVVDLAAGDSHMAAVKADGSAWTWGQNSYGQLGDGTAGAYRATPVQVKGPGGVGFLAGVAALAAGDSHTVALMTNGTVWSWGYNGYGQLGDGGAVTYSTTPVQAKGPGGVGFLTEVAALAAGDGYTVALKTNGTVWTWGSNSYGQLGIGSAVPNQTTPVQVKGLGGVGFLTAVAALAAGPSHVVAVKTDGTVWGWGLDAYGQLGDGATATYRTTPVQTKGPGGVGFLTGVAALAAGDSHTAAVKTDGTVWAWGLNDYGQLGDGAAVAYRSTPVQTKGPGGVGFLLGVVSLAAGDRHTAARKADGSVWTWGDNGNGQLGDGAATAFRNTPAQVKGAGGVGFLTSVTALVAGAFHTAALENVYTLAVVNGTGDGAYAPGTVVPIATTIPAGQLFVAWTGQVAKVADVNSATTSVTMNGHYTVTATFQAVAVQAAGTLSRDWVYQNTTQTTGGRHLVYLSVSVSGSTDFTVSVTKSAASAGDVTVLATADPLVWVIVGGPRQAGGLAGTGAVTLDLVVTDVPSGAQGAAQVNLTCRQLGDIDGLGGVNGQDRLLINKRLNGLVPTGPEFDLDSAGGVSGQDKLILNKILNGIAIP